jgi:hypothetical protein
MTTTSLLTFAPNGSIAPNFNDFAFDHDFILDGKPQRFKRNANGSLIPSIGAEVVTTYGIGYIERRHIGGDVVVRITEFDETVEVAQYADPVEVNAFGVVKGYKTAREHVGKKSSAETKAYRARIKAMADALLAEDEEETMPEGMADELAEVFGQ